MVRWWKLFGDQYIGFWAGGLVLFALQQLPYLVMPLFHLDSNPIMTMGESSVLLNLAEKLLGSFCIAAMTFLLQRQVPFFGVGSGLCKAGFCLMLAALLLNYLGWGLYFSGRQSVEVMLFFLVAMPPLYYAGIGLWRQNWVLLSVAIPFELVHLTHVYGNLKL